MNYNQNWNNPQQNWNQPPAPTPPPRKSGNKTTIIIIAIAVCVVGGLFYLASFLGKKFSETIGKVSESTMQRVDSLREYSNTQTYTALFNEINMNQEFSDSMRLALTRNITYLGTLTDDAKALLNKYDDGFDDTLKDQNAFSLLNKKWGNAYFHFNQTSLVIRGNLTTLRRQIRSYEDAVLELYGEYLAQNKYYQYYYL